MTSIAIAWIVCALIILLIYAGIGAAVNRNAFGILIDPRNKYSLSRLQLALWSLLIISFLVAVVFAEGRMDIVIPGPVWALLGLSAGSAAGAVIVKANKASAKPDLDKSESARAVKAKVSDAKAQRDAAVQQARASRSAAEGEAEAAKIAGKPTEDVAGVLHVADKPKFSQLFEGEELTDYRNVDISKVQMFLFTIAFVIGYAVVLWDWQIGISAELAKNPELPLKLPDLSGQIATILGISQAGYLTTKATPKTPREN